MAERRLFDFKELVALLVAAVFAGAAIQPFIPVSTSGVVTGGILFGILVYFAKELIAFSFRAERRFDIKGRELAIFAIAGILTQGFFLGFVLSFLTGNLTIFANGLAFYISYLVLKWLSSAI